MQKVPQYSKNGKNNAYGRFSFGDIVVFETQFTYFLSILIGLAAGLAAVTLKNFTHLIQENPTGDYLGDLELPGTFFYPL